MVLVYLSWSILLALSPCPLKVMTSFLQSLLDIKIRLRYKSGPSFVQSLVFPYLVFFISSVIILSCQCPKEEKNKTLPIGPVPENLIFIGRALPCSFTQSMDIYMKAHANI